jgi:endonuclease/exonuclease/phosphatase family metal-dependent hydrolase
VKSFVVPLSLVLTCCATGSRRAQDSSGLVCRQVTPDPGQLVSWISPAADRDRARLADWCAAVGPVVYQPEPAAHAAADVPARDRLAIVTWNTHAGGGDLDDLIERVRAGEFTHGERFDDIVMLVQEMYRSGNGVPDTPTVHAAIPGRIALGSHTAHERDVRHVAAAHGMAVLYTPSMRNGLAPDDPEDRGNAILSTIPLSEPAVIELPFERQRRVSAVASIAGRRSAGAPWRLRLANVHLDTALAIARGGPLTARRRQAELLIATLSESHIPTVVAGDFNAWLGNREPAIAALRQAFPDAPPASGPTWAGPLGIRATLDYVFARGEWRAIRVERLPHRFGSDHFPLLTVIDF